MFTTLKTLMRPINKNISPQSKNVTADFVAALMGWHYISL